jgi:hypothetical protein
MRKLWSILLEEARWPFKLLFVVALLLLFSMITGCATPLTEAERENRDYARAERAAKLEVCQRLYKSLNKPMISTHAHRRGIKHRDWEVRDDLWHNNCHRLLCQAKLWECGEY